MKRSLLDELMARVTAMKHQRDIDKNQAEKAIRAFLNGQSKPFVDPVDLSIGSGGR